MGRVDFHRNGTLLMKEFISGLIDWTEVCTLHDACNTIDVTLDMGQLIHRTASYSPCMSTQNLLLLTDRRRFSKSAVRKPKHYIV